MATVFLLENWRGFAIAALAGVFMALIGPFGTIAEPLVSRLAYWVPTMTAGAFAGFGVSAFARSRPRVGESPWLLWAVVSVGVSVPTTLFAWWYTGLLFGLPGGFATLFFYVLVISAAMTAIMMLVFRPGPATHVAAKDAGDTRVRFLGRLPPKLIGAAIYAVSAEDHYLRLHTSKGSDLILMRLSDAIAELEGIEGAQTHRSWWVARAAVESGRREGDKAVLTLKGGVEAPVSRPNVRPLKEAGWF
jgi:DNA-binding LytR/AlgR family response regulator